MNLIVIDDDEVISLSLINFLKLHTKHKIESANSVNNFINKFKTQDFDLIICDVKMPGFNGFDLLNMIKDKKIEFYGEIILITGDWSYDLFIKGISGGALSVMEKPVSLKAISELITKVEKKSTVPKNNIKNLKKTTEQIPLETDDYGFYSTAMTQLSEICHKTHNNRTLPVLIYGETGSGKEIIARLIHEGLKKDNKAFISLNCSAIPENLFESELFGYEGGAFTGSSSEGKMGKLELANGGTLFLDEIGDMPLSLQPKLLRVIQEKEFYKVSGNKKIKLDIRFVFATHKNLSEEVQNGTFREDLFFRISTIYLSVPPLRERKEEINQLSLLFLKKISRLNNSPVKYLNKECIKKLEKYNWPGNVRELYNVIERAYLLTNDSIIQPDDIIFTNSPINQNKLKENEERIFIDMTDKEISLDNIIRQVVNKTLLLYSGNKTLTAKKLNISINRLKRIMTEQI